MSATAIRRHSLEHKLRGVLERSVYWHLLSAELEGSPFEDKLGITSDALDVDLLETAGRRFSACARAMRVVEGAPMPRDGADAEFVEILDVFIAELEGEDRPFKDDKVLDAARLVLLHGIRSGACKEEPTGGSEAVSETAEPEMLRISLTAPYRRAFAVHMLAEMLGHLAECAGGGFKESGDPPAADTIAAAGIESALAWIEFVRPMGPLVELLAAAADPAEEFVAWPFGHDELLKRMRGCLEHLHESMDHTATDGVGRHAEAIVAAREYIESLELGVGHYDQAAEPRRAA